jgi:predicted ATPase/Tfp pilus assembly protein PilF
MASAVALAFFIYLFTPFTRRCIIGYSILPYSSIRRFLICSPPAVCMTTSFRTQVQSYRRDVGITQKQLAHALGLNPSVLSHKLNESDGMRLTHPEIKQIVKLLATWQAITTCTQAVALLESATLKSSAFSAEEWAQPPLKSLEGTLPAERAAVQADPGIKPSSRTVPAPTTPLLGRQTLVAEITARFCTSETRLLTLSGPGGVGKSRLAIEAGRQLASTFTDGVVFVPLAQINDPALVPSAITQALHIRGHAQSTPLEDLKTYLPPRHLLLILDNYEHLLTAAGLVSELLSIAPLLKILVTSRAILNIYGEHQVVVPPLPLPNLNQPLVPESASREPAIALFVARTRAVRGDFSLTPENVQAVAEICIKLDGLPLALELAAASGRLFAPRALLQRLNQRLPLLPGRAEDVSERQKTLNDTISWSYNLLEAKHQRLFELLSIFPGGATVEAAEALAPTPHDVAGGISELLDKSLIYQREGKDQQVRFTMLATIREYALAHIQGMDALRAKQSTYYASLTETLTPQLTGAHQGEAADTLDVEQDNLRAVLAWSVANAPLTALRLGGLLTYFWQLRGFAREGQGWLQQALLHPLPANAAPLEKAIYAQALHGMGVLAYLLGEYDRARYHLEQALTLRRTLRDPKAIAATLKNLGNVAWDQSDLDRAQEFYEEALAMAHQSEDGEEIAGVLNNLGSLLWQRDDLVRAEHYLTEALTMWRDLQNKGRMAMSLSNLGIIVLKQGKIERAGVLYAESLALFREIGERQGESGTLNNLSELALHQGNYPLAQQYGEASLAIRRDINYRWGIASTLLNLGSAFLFQQEIGKALVALQEAQGIFRDLGDRAKLAIILEYLGVTTLRAGDVEGALTYHREALGLSRELGDDFGVASSVACMAAVFAMQGKSDQAARYGGAAHAAWEHMGRPILPAHQQRFLPELTSARTQSDPAEFEQAWAEGAATFERLIADL